MSRVIKIILIIVLVPTLAIMGFLGYRYKTTPEQVIPYPYSMPQTPVELRTENIVLIGDKMADKFSNYLPILTENLSKGLNKEIKVTNLSNLHEGLHRTIHKLKTITPFPKVILYHGGSEEFFEKKFETKDIKKILKNLELYDLDTVQTLLLVSPKFSRLIYSKVDLINLSDSLQKDLSNYHEMEIQMRREIQFKIYEKEFKELLELIKSKESILVVISTPINFDAPTRKVCEIALNTELFPLLNESKKFKNSKDYKGLLHLLESAKEKFINHPEFLYELGTAYRLNENFSHAFMYLNLSVAHDCENWRGGPVYNIIQKNLATQYEAFYFDFHQMIQDEWSKNQLFVDDYFPQPLYYEKAAQTLGTMLKKYLKL